MHHEYDDLKDPIDRQVKGYHEGNTKKERVIIFSLCITTFSHRSHCEIIHINLVLAGPGAHMYKSMSLGPV